MMFLRKIAIILILGSGFITGCSQDKPKGIRVIYSGELSGYLEPCGCAEGIVGGLSRLGTAIHDSLRKWDGSAILLDAGGFAEPYTRKGDQKNRAILEAFSSLEYDAVNISPRDLLAGLDLLQWAQDTLGLPLISANLVYRATGKALFPRWVIKNIGNTKIGIISCGRVSLHDFSAAIPENLTFLDPATVLPDILAEIRPGCDLIILLCDFSAREARSLGSQNIGIDVIICTQDLLPTKQVRKFGNTYVVGVSRKGKKITTLLLKQSDDSSFTCSFSGKLLDNSVKKYPPVESIIKKYRHSTRVGK